MTLRLLPALLVLLVSALQAQTDSSAVTSRGLNLQQQSPDYFLLQAFHATTSQRRSLNHIGMLSETLAGGYVVGALLDGFPARQAGLRRGDRLLSVDGTAFHPLLSFNPHNGASQDPVTSHVLEYERNGVTDTVEVTPVRGNLYDAFRSATLASTQQIPNGNKLIGYLKLWSIDRSTDGIQTFRALIDSLAHCDGLVLDLREGYGFVSAEHLDRFFASRRSYPLLNDGNSTLWPGSVRQREDTDYYDRPIVVIQNGATRGGIEVFAHQLAKLERVISVGETTAGMAGRVHLDAAGAPVYSPAPDLRLDGVALEGNGIPPEQEVAYPLTDSPASDPQLEAAMLTLMSIL